MLCCNRDRCARLSAHQGAARARQRRSSRPLASAMLFWCMLARGEDHAHQQPSLTRKKLRRLEIAAGAPKYTHRPAGTWVDQPADASSRTRTRPPSRDLIQAPSPRPTSRRASQNSYLTLISPSQAAAPPACPLEVTEQSDRSPMTTAGGDLLVLSHGYLGAVVRRRALRGQEVHASPAAKGRRG